MAPPTSASRGQLLIASRGAKCAWLGDRSGLARAAGRGAAAAPDRPAPALTGPASGREERLEQAGGEVFGVGLVEDLSGDARVAAGPGLRRGLPDPTQVAILEGGR